MSEAPATAQAGAPRRDAERSRGAILDAAETQFASRGFAETTLQEIGSAAGLSRGTPRYFFGTKEALYRAVLERVFAERQAATARAFAPVVGWCEDADADVPALSAALRQATTGYLSFLLARPAFVTLLVREGLAGGEHLRSAPRQSTAMRDAFAAVREVGDRRGLAPFAVDDVVLVFVSLTFSPVALQPTLMASLGRDLAQPAQRRRHVDLVVDRILSMLVSDERDARVRSRGS
ncbi:MAG TPA: TetR family transcriptional regulator [Capillimicrobium sp.]